MYITGVAPARCFYFLQRGIFLLGQLFMNTALVEINIIYRSLCNMLLNIQYSPVAYVQKIRNKIGFRIYFIKNFHCDFLY